MGSEVAGGLAILIYITDLRIGELKTDEVITPYTFSNPDLASLGRDACGPLEPSGFIPISNYPPTEDWKNPAKPNDGIFEVGKILGRQYVGLVRDCVTALDGA